MLPDVERLATLVVCEDDETTLELLCEHLEAERFSVLPAPSASDALRLCHFKQPDMLLLDLRLPDAGGLDVLRTIRGADGVTGRYDPGLPVMILSGRGSEADRLRGLIEGADDYVTKPFHPSEVSARVKAILRRRSGRREGPVRVGEIVVDTARREVRVAGRAVELANKEFAHVAVKYPAISAFRGIPEAFRSTQGSTRRRLAAAIAGPARRSFAVSPAAAIPLVERGCERPRGSRAAADTRGVSGRPPDSGTESALSASSPRGRSPSVRQRVVANPVAPRCARAHRTSEMDLVGRGSNRDLRDRLDRLTTRSRALRGPPGDGMPTRLSDPALEVRLDVFGLELKELVGILLGLDGGQRLEQLGPGLLRLLGVEAALGTGGHRSLGRVEAPVGAGADRLRGQLLELRQRGEPDVDALLRLAGQARERAQALRAADLAERVDRRQLDLVVVVVKLTDEGRNAAGVAQVARGHDRSAAHLRIVVGERGGQGLQLVLC